MLLDIHVTSWFYWAASSWPSIQLQPIKSSENIHPSTFNLNYWDWSINKWILGLCTWSSVVLEWHRWFNHGRTFARQCHHCPVLLGFAQTIYGFSKAHEVYVSNPRNPRNCDGPNVTCFIHIFSHIWRIWWKRYDIFHTYTLMYEKMLTKYTYEKVMVQMWHFSYMKLYIWNVMDQIRLFSHEVSYMKSSMFFVSFSWMKSYV